MKPLIVILGPTASGKTNLAKSLAKKFNGEIICADSRTIYRHLDIGTAKPYLPDDYHFGQKLKLQKLKFKTHSQSQKIVKKYHTLYRDTICPISISSIPHWMLDVVSPHQIFTTAQFRKMAQKIIDNILQRDKIPFLVGGTGLYLDAITKGLTIPHVAPDWKLRQELEQLPNKQLADKLKVLDKITWLKIDQNNPRRLIRALEVCLKLKKPFSDFQKKEKPKYQVLKIGIEIPKEKLNEKIEKRVDKMIEDGLVNEVKNLLKKGYNLKLPAMSGLGYKQIINNPNNLPKAVEEIKLETKQYAKRQMTWFNKDQEIHWVKNQKEAKKLINQIL